MTHHTFTTPSPIRLDLDNGSGRVTVRATETGETTVEVSGRHADEVVVSHDGDTVSVSPPRPRLGFLSGDQTLDITVVAPLESTLEVRVGSSDVDVTGLVGRSRVRSGSGDVSIEQVEGSAYVEAGSGDLRIGRVSRDLRAKSGSGSVTVADVAGTASVVSGSGDVTIGLAGTATVVRTGSGDLEVGDTDGDVSLTTGSGDLTVRNARGGRLSTKGGSGDVHVAVPRGLPVWTDITTITGQVRSDLESVGQPAEGAPHVEVRARTMSGDVVLTHS
jgi:DUF4097 and DUF4098 domain-containing protein YvlB